MEKTDGDAYANEEKKQLTPFQRRKIESSRRGRGKSVTGTTQGMYKESQTDTKLRTMENNLTETHREMEIQRLEIRRLRNQVETICRSREDTTRHLFYSKMWKWMSTCVSDAPIFCFSLAFPEA